MTGGGQMNEGGCERPFGCDFVGFPCRIRHFRLQAVSRNVARGVECVGGVLPNPWKFLDPRSEDEELTTGPASADSSLSWDSERRARRMALEGIAAEVLFPNTPTPFIPDSTCRRRVRKAGTSTNIDGPGSRLTIAGWPILFGESRPAGGCRRSIAVRHCRHHGRGPRHPRFRSQRRHRVPGRRGRERSLTDLLHRLRAAVELCEDVGCRSIATHGRRRPGVTPHGSRGGCHRDSRGRVLGSSGPFPYHFSRVLERHPGLRFVFTETGVGWLPAELARLDGIYNLSRLPREDIGLSGFCAMPSPSSP